MSKKKEKWIYGREGYNYDRKLKMDGYDWGTKYVDDEEFAFQTTMKTILECYKEYLNTKQW